MHYEKGRLRSHQTELGLLEAGDLTDDTSLWCAMLLGGGVTRKIDRQESDFEDAKRLIQRLRPNDVCIKEEDWILWEFRKLEKTYTKAQLEPDATTMCERRNLLPDQLSKRISQLNLERYWLQLAYQQSRADAYAHCARNSKYFLPPTSFEILASHWIAEYERNIAGYDHVPAQLDACKRGPRHLPLP